MSGKVLIVHTLQWPNAARLAIAFREVGCQVQILCTRSHPLRALSCIERVHTYNPFAALRSFRMAIENADPDLIVACDDWSVRVLHRLYLSASTDEWSRRLRDVIRKSLGRPEGYAMSTRSRLPELAGAAGILLPRTDRIANPAQVDKWIGAHGLPAVVKGERSTSGARIRIVATSAEAKRAFRWLKGSGGPIRATKRLFWNNDPEGVLDLLWREQNSVSLQAFVPGTPANCAVACWEGEVIAAICVEVVATVHPTGPSTVIRVIEHHDMIEAARIIVDRLGMSGFCGLDFIIEQSSRRAYLIEVNPRATQINHLALGEGRDLVTAIASRISGVPLKCRPRITDRDLIALFPQQLLREPRSAFLAAAYFDIPTNEDRFVRSYAGRNG